MYSHSIKLNDAPIMQKKSKNVLKYRILNTEHLGDVNGCALRT